jgi:hypothetical protein
MVEGYCFHNLYWIFDCLWFGELSKSKWFPVQQRSHASWMQLLRVHLVASYRRFEGIFCHQLHRHSFTLKDWSNRLPKTLYKECLSVNSYFPKDIILHSLGTCNGTFPAIQNPYKRSYDCINPLTPELNPSAQLCLTRLFTGDFASWTVHFVNICVKNQQIHQLFIQFIKYVW